MIWINFLCHGLILLMILMTKKLLERFTKKNWEKKSKTKKDNKLYVKWQQYNNLLISCIDKKEIV